ncbi:unnamed protein product [Allacma fusca]|uniref:Cuticle protein n=1 Tax=Allacma fusca TaxID=39272 RepID=A0A8J2MA91_9HEXA|nr:unnamed protein product [Allacma fusca]
MMTFVTAFVDGSLSGWKSTPTQYHIQTDEGPERSFRFQTYNGQYRREKRLDDGTVIGSYGWVDPTGFLRMTDYIADGKGYRIVKTRMEFVGSNSVEASETKKIYVPAKHSTKVVTKIPSVFDTAVETTSENPTAAVETETTSPEPEASSSIPLVHDHPTPTTSAKPEKIPFWTRKPSEKSLYSPGQPRNGTYVATYVGPGRLRIRRPVARISAGRQEGSDVFGTYATPLRKPTGFIYKIPHQYHKEETDRDGSRLGSFGYVDPFGIRRVIHYNAGVTGFDAARDFKFVGRQY